MFRISQLSKNVDRFLKEMATRLLILEAKKTLANNNPKVIAIAGSVGKTSTQEAIYCLLSQLRTTRHTTGDYNAIVGACRTVLDVPTAGSNILQWLKNIYNGARRAYFSAPYPEQLVIEAGISKPGEMARFAFLRPEVVVYTRFPDVPAHAGNFATAEEVMAEKLLLKDALRADGTLIINADDPKMTNLKVEKGQRLMSYGMHTDATVRGSKSELLYEEGVPVGVRCDVTYQSETLPLTIKGVLGKHHAYPLLAALAVAVAEGIVFKDVVVMMHKYVGPKGRMRLLEGMNDSLLIDDTYNSSPEAMKAGMETVTELQVEGKKILVLGDMLELGEYSDKEHDRIGEQAASTCDMLVTVGPCMARANEVARRAQGRAKRVEIVNDVEQAIELLRNSIEKGDVVFIKGSGATGMERVTKGLLRDPSTAKDALVRLGKKYKPTC